MGKIVCTRCNGSGQEIDDYKTIEDTLKTLNDGWAFVYHEKYPKWGGRYIDEIIDDHVYLIVGTANLINNNYFSSNNDIESLGTLYNVYTTETFNSQGYKVKSKKIGDVDENLFGKPELTEIINFFWPNYRFADYSETEEVILNSGHFEPYRDGHYLNVIEMNNWDNGYYPVIYCNDIGQVRYKIRNYGLRSTWKTTGRYEHLDENRNFKPYYVFNNKGYIDKTVFILRRTRHIME